MDAQQTRATLTVALMAAFADGLKDERERDAVKQVADALGGEAGIDLPALFRDVLLSKPDLAQVVAPLNTVELKQYAYEMAVGVANSDGAQNDAERDFLQKLATALKLPAEHAAQTSAAAESIATAAAADATPAPPAQGTVLGRSGLAAADYDKMILDASIMNAALELLPESIASMAIIPLQMRLVYRIGKSYGYPMDMSQAKDFVATLGVGLTGQYVEQLGRRLLGGLLGGLAGGLGRAVGRQAASSGMSFATTYALGRVAQRYYASGRNLDTAMLKETFTSLVTEARGLAPQYRRQIEQQASSIDTRSLASLIKQA
ncbi:MAG TPA: DUF533 domain-containing protein [Steroidobacteraceae bacterium]